MTKILPVLSIPIHTYRSSPTATFTAFWAYGSSYRKHAVKAFKIFYTKVETHIILHVTSSPASCCQYHRYWLPGFCLSQTDSTCPWLILTSEYKKMRIQFPLKNTTGLNSLIIYHPKSKNTVSFCYPLFLCTPLALYTESNSSAAIQVLSVSDFQLPATAVIQMQQHMTSQRH